MIQIILEFRLSQDSNYSRIQIILGFRLSQDSDYSRSQIIQGFRLFWDLDYPRIQIIQGLKLAKDSDYPIIQTFLGFRLYTNSFLFLFSSNRIHTLKCKKSPTSCCKDVRLKKSKFVAKTQFLWENVQDLKQLKNNLSTKKILRVCSPTQIIPYF